MPKMISGRILTSVSLNVQLSSPPPVQHLQFSDSSPMFLRRSSPTSSLNDDEDDGFQDIMDYNMEVRTSSYSISSMVY